MNNIFDMENLKNKLELYKIEDEKNKYVFRANLRYMISSSIFFIVKLFYFFICTDQIVLHRSFIKKDSCTLPNKVNY